MPRPGTLKIWDLVRLILEILRLVLSFASITGNEAMLFVWLLSPAESMVSKCIFDRYLAKWVDSLKVLHRIHIYEWNLFNIILLKMQFLTWLYQLDIKTTTDTKQIGWFYPTKGSLCWIYLMLLHLVVGFKVFEFHFISNADETADLVAVTGWSIEQSNHMPN